MPTTITPNLPFAGATFDAAVLLPTDKDQSALGLATPLFWTPFFFVAIASPNLPLLMISKY
jgi:hypothetical protein